jgi:hypothetical protein
MRAKMNKYVFTLATLFDSKSKIKNQYSADTIISSLFDGNLDEIDFIKSLSELELIYGFEIPEDFYDKTNLTLEQFAEQLSQMPVIISEEQYPEFYDIKITSMKLTKRFVELETKIDKDSLSEKCMINNKFEELDDRLNNLL